MAAVFTVVIVFLIAYGLWRLAFHTWPHAARRVDNAIASLDDPDDSLDNWAERALRIATNCRIENCATCALERENVQ
jgi:hypothetical protein